MGRQSTSYQPVPWQLTALMAQLILVSICLNVPLVDGSGTSSSSSNSSGEIAPKLAPTIKLGVFMESRCPDTRRFFRDQLVPTHRLIGQAMEVTIVPFGHARTLGNNRIICQHGERECEGNRRMACVIARTKNQTQVVETVGCLLRVDGVPKECLAANAPSIDFDELEKCTAGDESYRLMVEAEKATGRLNYVPHLTVDGKSGADIQDQAENSLRQYMCQLYTGSAQLEPCKSESSASNDNSKQFQ